MIWVGLGDEMNMTLFGVAESCSATIRTAVRSSMESPNEMISRARGPPALGGVVAAEPSSLPESDDTSVKHALASSGQSPSALLQDSKTSLTS